MDTSNRSCEPMDIDLSTNSGNHSAMDISYTSDASGEKQENNTITQSTDQKKSPSRQSSRKLNIKRNTLKRTNTVKLKIILSTVSVLISLLVYNVVNFKCSGELDVHSIMKILHEKVHGQQEAIEDLTKALTSNDRSKIIFLYGGTGVGKTLTVSLIFESLWSRPNVYHYIMPNFVTSFSTDFLLGLALCDKSYLIVDNLIENDMAVNTHIKDFITKSEDLGKHVTVILLYNCDNTSNGFIKKCDQSFDSILQKSFSEIKAAKYFIHYEALLEAHLRMCIKNELRNNMVSDLEMNRLIKNFDVSLDGCKGVHMKMKLLRGD